MSKEQLKSLRALIDYIYSDEETHWIESEMLRANHIFLDIKKIAKWLKIEEAKQTKPDTKDNNIERLSGLQDKVNAGY